MILSPFSVTAALLSALAAWAGFWVLVRKAAHSDDWRLNWVLTSVAWGVWLTLVVEAGSALAILGRPYLFAAFAIPACLGLLVAVRTLTAQKGNSRTASARFGLSRAEILLVGMTTGFVLLLAAQCVVLAPTTFDSMTYHLPRIMHWMQQHTVGFYPTLNVRQLESGPWAEFAVMSLYSLAGSDRLVCLVQWFAMVTSLVGASLITSQLLALLPASKVRLGRANTIAAIVAPLLLAMLPIGIAESVSTQNDYVTACWLVCFVALVIAQLQRPESLFWAVATGSALGLGALTKSTFLLIALPISAVGFVLLWVCLRRYLMRLRVAAIWALSIALLTMPHACRNLHRFGSVLGSPGTAAMVRVAGMTPGGTASNVIRNLTLQTGTGSPLLTRHLNDALLWAHRLTGYDLNDPTTTFPYTPFATYEHLLVSDSFANSGYHLLLVLLAGGVFFFTRDRYGPALSIYVAAAIFSFLVFCAYLRWQPWLSRFYIGYYALLMPVVAIVLSRGLRWLVYPAAFGFLAFGAYSFLANVSEPPITKWLSQDREAEYFLSVPVWHTAFVTTAEVIVASHCDRVGFAIGFDGWEYPIWQLLKNRGFTGTLDSVYDDGQPDNGRLLEALKPCAVIVFAAPAPAEVIRTMQQLQRGLPIPIYAPPAAR